jgi:hypothetical protein
LIAPACWAEDGSGQPSEYDRRHGYSEHYGVVTPRDVLALANNFNTVLDYYLETHASERAAAIRVLRPEAVSGKSSDDLLDRSRRLAELVDEIGAGRHLPPVLRIDRAGERTLPAEAYLQIGASLDGLIFFLSALDASQIWGDYYVTIHSSDEKSPDDAFSVVDLAVRKLELATGRIDAQAPAEPGATAGTADPVPAEPPAPEA